MPWSHCLLVNRTCLVHFWNISSNLFWSRRNQIYSHPDCPTTWTKHAEAGTLGRQTSKAHSPPKLTSWCLLNIDKTSWYSKKTFNKLENPRACCKVWQIVIAWKKKRKSSETPSEIKTKPKPTTHWDRTNSQKVLIALGQVSKTVKPKRRSHKNRCSGCSKNAVMAYDRISRRWYKHQHKNLLFMLSWIKKNKNIPDLRGARLLEREEKESHLFYTAMWFSITKYFKLQLKGKANNS